MSGEDSYCKSFANQHFLRPERLTAHWWQVKSEAEQRLQERCLVENQLLWHLSPLMTKSCCKKNMNHLSKLFHKISHIFFFRDSLRFLVTSTLIFLQKIPPKPQQTPGSWGFPISGRWCKRPWENHSTSRSQGMSAKMSVGVMWILPLANQKWWWMVTICIKIYWTSCYIYIFLYIYIYISIYICK